MTASTGDWVRIGFALLQPAERAANLPEETARTPYVMYANGFLVAPAEIGEVAVVQTHTGRELTGTLLEENPGHWHTYGQVHPEFHAVTRYITSLQRSLRNEQ